MSREEIAKKYNDESDELAAMLTATVGKFGEKKGKVSEIGFLYGVVKFAFVAVEGMDSKLEKILEKAGIRLTSLLDDIVERESK